MADAKASAFFFAANHVTGKYEKDVKTYRKDKKV